jgi:hypothetical protein
MSCSNNQVEKKRDADTKGDADKKTELTFLSSPIHDYVRLIAISLVAAHFGNVIYKHSEITTFLQNNPSYNIVLLFAFFYLNSNYKLEISIVCTIAVQLILHSLKLIKTQK